MTGNAEEGRIVPTYQYVCTSCEAPLEVVQSFSDPSLTECPACDGGKLRKVFSAVGVVFKGSGFYRTDSRAGGKTGGDAGGKAGSSGTGGDAKGAADKGGESGAKPAKSDAAPAAKGGSKAAGTSSTSPSPSTSSAKPTAKSA